PGAGKDYLERGIAGPTGLQHRELGPAIDFKVGPGINHRIKMTRLPSQIKEIVFPLDEILHAVGVTHVGDVDLRPVLQTLNIEKVAAVIGDQAINESQVSPQASESPRQVGANKAQSSRDQNLGSRELAHGR